MAIQFINKIENQVNPQIDNSLQIKQAPEPTIMGSKFFGKVNEGLKKITEPIQELFRPYSVKTEKERLATTNAVNEQSLIDTSFSIALKAKDGYKPNNEELAIMQQGKKAFESRNMDLAMGFLTPEMKVIKPITDDITKVATNKLIQAIKEAKPLRAEAEKLYTVEKGIRAELGTEAMSIGGEKGYIGALSKLKGELPKPKFEGVRAPSLESKVSPELQSLAEEAKKYKSAEEFVKAQPKVYHTTTKDFSEFQLPKTRGGSGEAKAVFFSDTVEGTKYYQRQGGKIMEANISADAKIFDYKKDVSIIDEYVNKLDNYNLSQKESAKRLLTSGDWGSIESEKFQSFLKSKGYDGFRAMDMTGNETLGITNVSKIKTKSQLTDIYNQATKKVLPDGGQISDKLLNQQEIDSLFTKIQQTPKLDFYNKVTASNGLSKILNGTGGSIPTEGELKLLQNIFGEDLVKTILSKRGGLEKFWENVKSTLNVPRALVSSVDMSAPLRQGLVLTTSHPVKATEAGVDMVKSFFSPKAYDALMENISNRSSFKLMQDSGLAISDISGKAISLSSKEEAFMTNFAEKIPIFGKVVKASERAYTGFLNKIRADVFDDLTSRYIEGGIIPNENPQFYKFLAEFVNTASGRGNLGKTLNQSAPLLNSIFFSPRLMMSRFNMLNPVWYAKLPPPIRREAAKSFVKMVGTGLGVLSLAKLGGAEVEDDIRSTDFGKIKVGNTRWDVWGGFQQWARLVGQLYYGQTKSIESGKITNLGKDYGAPTRLDKLNDFFIGKLAPVPALMADLTRGSNMIGQPVDISEKIIPFYIKDLVDAYNDIGGKAIPLIGIPGFFGVGTQTYEKNKKKSGSIKFR